MNYPGDTYEDSDGNVWLTDDQDDPYADVDYGDDD